jgi:hypothetical protein
LKGWRKEHRPYVYVWAWSWLKPFKGGYSYKRRVVNYSI